MTKAKQVFISHATADARFAHRLADDLQRLGVQVWIAPESIHPGESWVDAIERGLEESSHTVVVLTPQALKSQWVKKETEVAIAQERRGRIQVIPLDVEPCAVPLLLSSYQMVSFRHDYDTGLSQLATILGLRITPPEPLRLPHHTPPHGTVPEAVLPAMKEKPAVRGGLPVWGWGAIALMAALVVGGAIFLATQGGNPTVTPVPVVQAATPTATVTATATATPMPPTDTPTSTSTPTKTPTPVPHTATPVVPMPTDTPLPPTNTPTNAPTDTPTPVPPTDTPTPYVVTTKPTPTPAAELTAADFRIASPTPQADGTYPKDTPLEFGFILKNNNTRVNIPLSVICVLVLDVQGEEKSRSCISPYLQLPPRESQSFSIKAESGLASGQYYAEIWYATWRGAVAQNSEGYKAAINFTIK